MFCDNSLHLHTKVGVSQAVCISTRFETRTTYTHHLKQLESFHIKCLQRILKVTWQDCVQHSMVQCSSIEGTIMQHQLS